jgi:Fe-S oxidoreductase
MISNIIFVLILICTILFFYRNVRIIARNIKLGRDVELKDNKTKRWRLMFKVAIGQSKMVTRPIAGIFHIFIYVGFIIVNIEMLEIIIDGIAGTHRLFAFFGSVYNVLISSFEFFAVAVVFACVIFLIRRNILKVRRFWNEEMTLWPRSDANIILITEIFLMSALFTMNATDRILQLRGLEHYINIGSFPLSGLLLPLFNGLPDNTLIFLERFGWWFHIVGVFAFLNYIPYSKHFHVFLSFPNVYYSNLKPKGEIAIMPAVTKEVKFMLDNSTMEPVEEENGEEVTFGAKNIKDLTWKNLMDAYSCTECGRCTSSCPANITGKKLSPRKVIMDTRDRLEIVGKNLDKKGKLFKNNQSLFYFITPEELWACTTCNACTEECPVNIDPLSIIIEMRRYIVMEQADAPAQLNSMFTNIENNGAPWQFSQEDRMLWAKDLNKNNTKVKVPVMADIFAEDQKPEYLYWVGCAGAFDDRYKKVTRAFVKILNHLNISYAVLGTEESCTGDPARRAGNEMLFQMQALMNIEILNNYEVKKILTTCPHCYNTLKNEYPELGGKYEVIHYTQFLSELFVNEGKLKIDTLQSAQGKNNFKDKKITFHDPCYLGRANSEYDAPRKVLSAIPNKIIEMKRNKNFALCCGAGGGQMFKEAEKGDKEIFLERIEDVLETGADILATACPFCMVMLTDGLKYKNKEKEIKNYDIIEMIALSLGL